VSTSSGFPRTEIEVDGKRYGVLLDTGASFTMISQSLLETWGPAHTDWKRQRGAVGEAATLARIIHRDIGCDLRGAGASGRAAGSRSARTASTRSRCASGRAPRSASRLSVSLDVPVNNPG